MKRIFLLIFIPGLYLACCLSTHAASDDAVLPSSSTILKRASQEPWGKELRPIPAIVIHQGPLRDIPYQSFAAGEYMLSVYGDPEKPIGVEVGVRSSLAADEGVRTQCLQFVTALLPNHFLAALQQLLAREHDFVIYPDVNFEIKHPTDEGMRGEWAVAVYVAKRLDSARASEKELARISISKPGNWTAEDLKLARAKPAGVEYAAASATIDGLDFKNVRMTKRNPKEAIICDAFGVFVYPMADLSFALQKELGCDPGAEALSQGLGPGGGAAFLLKIDLPRKDPERAMAGVVDVMQRRIRRFGGTNVSVQVQRVAENRVVLQMPGLRETDREDARRALEEPAVLEFRLVHADNEELETKTPSPDFVPPPGYTNMVERENRGDEIFIHRYYVKCQAEQNLSGRHVRLARVAYNDAAKPYIIINFTGEGTALFRKITSENVGRQLAVLIDGEILTVPVIQEEVAGGEAQIAGNFSTEAAQRLAVALSNPLPTPVTVLESRRVLPVTVEPQGVASTNQPPAIAGGTDEARVYLKNYSRKNGVYGP